MFAVIFQFFRWVIEKFAVGVLIALLGFVACGLWLYLKDTVNIDTWQQEVVRTIRAERARTKGALDDVQKRMDRIGAEITAENEHGRQADKIIENLKDLQSTWDRYVGDRAQQQANDERIASVSATRMGITKKIDTLQQDFNRATLERDVVQTQLERVDARLKAEEEERSVVMRYAELTWNYEVGRGPVHLPIRWWMAVALGVYFLGPTVAKLAMYFVVAPRIARGRPVRLEASAAALPEVGESKAAATMVLRPGERLWIKGKYLPGLGEGPGRKTRAVLDWRIPITCVATGLTGLVEVSPSAGGGESEAAPLTLSDPGDPDSEIALVTLAEGASLVLRPSFLVGVVTTADGKLKMRRRWQLFRWQAWVTRQFRFFEFVGPCQLVVAGSRGVRVEQLLERAGGGYAARRAAQDATMGFTPALDYRPARAETFWSYYRGQNALFDDLFVGKGIFLREPAVVDRKRRKARGFWAGLRGGAMKLFGM